MAAHNNQMFLELPEIVEIGCSISKLESNHQAISSRLQPHSNPIQQSLTQTFQNLEVKTSELVDMIGRLGSSVDLGYFIPEDIDPTEIIESAHLPQWFGFVFAKQYKKVKKDYDIIAKKTLRLSNITEFVAEVEGELIRFKTLLGRQRGLKMNYQFLDILGDAKSLQAKVELLRCKYLSYCESVTDKLCALIQEHADKSIAYASGSAPSLINTRSNVYNPSRIGSFMNSQSIFLGEESKLGRKTLGGSTFGGKTLGRTTCDFYN